MKWFYRNIFIVIMSIICVSNTNAQTDSTAENFEVEVLSFEELMAMTVTSSSKTEQTISEAPSTMTAIAKEQIANFGWRSINDILYKQPGFGPSQDYDRKTVAGRGYFEGWNNNHLLFLIDGIPVNDNIYGTAYTSEITPSFLIGSLEIIRGPGSALYGSNATNGVIQINTPSASDLTHSIASGFMGTNGNRIFNFLTGHVSANFDAVLGVNYSETKGDNFYSYDGSGRMIDNQLQNYVVRDKRKNSYIWGKITGKNMLDGLELQVHLQDWSYQTGHGWLWFIPDADEGMNESRQIVSLRYKNSGSKFMQEYLLRYQTHNIDWNMRYYPNGAFADFYPTGMWEYLNTSGHDIFGRSQWTYKLEKKTSLLAGIEGDVFFYNGDNEHYSNINVDDAVNYFPPFDAQNRNNKLGSWFEYVKNKPVTNLAFYAQFISGEFLSDKLTVTLGARYDMEFFNYIKIDEPNRPTANKSFSQFSPRLAVVYKANEDISLKLLYSKAFRAPAPSEMFGAHTFTLASNIDQLKPEIINTAELALDWKINSHFNWRTNIYHSQFDNQIAYSAANNNLSTNMFSFTHRGLETELLFGYSMFSGFVNYNYIVRVDENIIDPTIKKMDELTWEPTNRFNFGFTYTLAKLNLSVAGHYQGVVNRRTSDIGLQVLPLGVNVELDMDKYRPTEVKPWLTLDLNAKYKITDYLTFGIAATNLLDKEYYLVKNLGFPFDYRQEGRRVLGFITLTI